eukprot:UN30676
MDRGGTRKIKTIKKTEEKEEEKNKNKQKKKKKIEGIKKAHKDEWGNVVQSNVGGNDNIDFDGFQGVANRGELTVADISYGSENQNSRYSTDTGVQSTKFIPSAQKNHPQQASAPQTRGGPGPAPPQLNQHQVQQHQQSRPPPGPGGPPRPPPVQHQSGGHQQQPQRPGPPQFQQQPGPPQFRNQPGGPPPMNFPPNQPPRAPDTPTQQKATMPDYMTPFAKMKRIGLGMPQILAAMRKEGVDESEYDTWLAAGGMTTTT